MNNKEGAGLNKNNILFLEQGSVLKDEDCKSKMEQGTIRVCPPQQLLLITTRGVLLFHNLHDITFV
jgi:hypothetical protein